MNARYKDLFFISVRLILAAAFGGQLTACHSSKSEVEQEPVRLISDNRLHISAEAMSNLRFSNVMLTDFPEILPMMGKISPTEDRTFTVPARAAGRIETVLVASGESVTAGKPLATIFSPDFIAAREEYLQSIRKSKSSDSDSDFGGLAALSKRKLMSMGLSATDVADLEGSASEMNLIVRAPRAGALIAKNAVVGNQVSQGDPLYTIADLHEVWFVGDLYPDDISKAKKGQEIIVGGTPNGRQLKGRVSFISPVVDPLSRTIKVRALVPNPDLQLRADMYLQGNLVMKDRQTLMIPSNSIFRDHNETYVFKVAGSRTIEGHASGFEAVRIKVQTEGERAGATAIKQGLTAGEEVISDGALLLNAALVNSSTSIGK